MNRQSTARVVLTDKYERSHMRRPRGEGSWLFRNVDTDQWVELGGRYGEVRRALPAGTWELLP